MIITIISFCFVLGITVFIHELGHFLMAKKAGIYIYEFSIGMGPKIYGFKRKNDETAYSIRLFPIGGYVQMAGEEVELDQNLPEEKQFRSKTWLQKFSTVVAGIVNNFLLAIFLLFLVALISGAPTLKTYIGSVEENYPASHTSLTSGDQILKVNGKKTATSDAFLLELQLNHGKPLELEVKHQNGSKQTIVIEPKIEDGEAYYGFSLDSKIKHNVLAALEYAFLKFFSLLEQMVMIIFYLFTGKLSLNSLSGPVGIFTIVGETAKSGIVNLLYLTGYISLNVGFMNLLPIPAFDGGRLLFLIIEKIRRKPVSQKVENTIHAVGFIFLMILMVVITFNDILRFF